MNILIVEDDPTTAAFLFESIKELGHSPESAFTGREALNRIKKKDFDMVFLDIFLPDGEGQRLIPKMKEHKHDIGIVTMTGYNSRELELEVRTMGTLYYMNKPISFQVLSDIINRVEHHLTNKAR